MYDVGSVLAALDRNKWGVLLLCGLAMACNYTWFVAALRRGLRDRVVPIPIFCTLLWLVGDASMVLRYELWFRELGHWYVKLFWLALVFTVACELVFLWLTWRFGRAEFAPRLTQAQFGAALAAGVLAMAVGFESVKRWMGDPLYVNYFHFANLAGPTFGAALWLRRGTRAGTTPLIWCAYALMVASWSIACALWYGPPFAEPGFLVLYATATLAAVGMAMFVGRLPHDAV
jgi:hypothetical protein